MRNAREQQRLDIYKRQNSEFNRLLSNKINYSRYDDIDDQDSKVEPTTQRSRDQYKRQHSVNEFVANKEDDVETSEYRHFKLRKRPCVPVYPHHRRGPIKRRSTGRTLYDLNLYFLGYQPNRYEINPVPPVQPVQPVSSVESPASSSYDHYSGYDCSPNPFYRPPLHSQIGSYGGNYGNNQYGNNQLADYPNQPSALGQFGQGLFDFFNGLFGYGNPNSGGGSGGYDTPAGTLADQNNADRPVYEINVPDTIQALVRKEN